MFYYSTQPVRIDGLEVDPVNGGAIVLALAGALSSTSTFITKDSAYLISSDAVVKVGDLPVSLHIPDYQAAYQNGSAALNKGQAAYNNASSLNPVNLSDINIPNPKNLIPSTDGPINLAVSLSKVGEELGEFEVPGKILPVDDLPKLPLTGSVQVNLLANGGASVAVHVALPDVLSDGNGHGLTGDTTLSIDNTNGLELNNLHILIPSASDVGSAGLKSLELTYSRQPQVFDGRMVLDLGLCHGRRRAATRERRLQVSVPVIPSRSGPGDRDLPAGLPSGPQRHAVGQSHDDLVDVADLDRPRRKHGMRARRRDRYDEHLVR